MRALADMAFLREGAGLLRPTARRMLGNLVDEYHATFPTSPLAVIGEGLHGIDSTVSIALTQAREDKETKERETKEAAVAAEQERKRTERERERMDALQDARVIEKARARAAVEKVDKENWDRLSKWGNKFEAQNATWRLENQGWNKSGWKSMAWPPPASGSVRNSWMPEKDRAAVTVVYADIRDLEDATLEAQLDVISDRVLDLFGGTGPELDTYTLCLLGNQSQTPNVCTKLCSLSWQWGTPYVITIASAAYTLGNDYDAAESMHPLCMDADENGDSTFGTQRGVIFRLFRPGNNDSTIRKKGTGATCWNAGREEFITHRNKLVPTISRFHESEPYVFLLTVPRRILHARFPYLFARFRVRTSS
jgi:hypothetical protein